MRSSSSTSSSTRSSTRSSKMSPSPIVRHPAFRRAHARKLLTRGLGMMISDIAEESGLDDLSAFKTWLRTNPRWYRSIPRWYSLYSHACALYDEKRPFPPSLYRALSRGEACAICLERISFPHVRPCGHVFCRHCARRVAFDPCPCCREEPSERSRTCSHDTSPIGLKEAMVESAYHAATAAISRAISIYTVCTKKTHEM